MFALWGSGTLLFFLKPLFIFDEPKKKSPNDTSEKIKYLIIKRKLINSYNDNKEIKIKHLAFSFNLLMSGKHISLSVFYTFRLRNHL